MQIRERADGREKRRREQSRREQRAYDNSTRKRFESEARVTDKKKEKEKKKKSSCGCGAIYDAEEMRQSTEADGEEKDESGKCGTAKRVVVP